MQVYLPETLYQRVKSRSLRRQDLLAETDRYLADLLAEVGAPTPAPHARASVTARRLARRSLRRVG
jgi:hypothetical protein